MPHREVPENVTDTPDPEPERPSGNWPHRVEQKLDSLGRRFDRVEDFLTGTLDKEGLVTRVNRIEEAERVRRRWTGAAIVAAITAAVGSVWQMFTGHHV
jgi:predicted butyrate kinase (DUF1464 family)